MLGLIREAGDDELFHPIAPSHLHHSESRGNHDTVPDDVASSGSSEQPIDMPERRLPRIEDEPVESPVRMPELSTRAVSEPVGA